MPIMDGYETAELIYERDKLKNIPIIFITAHDYEEEAMFKGYQAGAVDFIRKPFKPEILRSKVAVFAELYRKNRLLRKQEEKLQIINNDLMLANQELEQRVLERTIELENLNKELKELNLSKDKFLSVISHDLRNPLTSLLISSKNLNTNLENLGAKEITMFAGIIHRTSNKILEQLNELVDWAKKQREKTNFNPENFQLLDGVKQSFELIKPNAVQKSIAVKIDIDENIHVSADPPMFRSIIQNLVTNAIKFTPHGGVITCTAKSAGSMIEICVQDHGVGMSDEIKEMLLGNYAYLSSTGTDQEQGSGLGLFLVKEFINQHGGTVNIDSELGKGTCFFFTIPKVENPSIAEI